MDQRLYLGFLIAALVNLFSGILPSVQCTPEKSSCYFEGNQWATFRQVYEPASRGGICPNGPPPSAPRGGSGAVPLSQPWEEVAGEYIVRFNTYRMAEEHRRLLADSLAGEDGWAWIPRSNAAAKFPTDFGLVRLELHRVASLLALVAGVAGVKDVHPQRRMTRALSWDSSAVRSPTRIAGCRMWDDGVRVHKQQGRLCTKPSIGLEDDTEGEADGLRANLSSTVRRRLQASRSGVTGMFSAEKLWALGYKGQHVRMGVFDTGIRADHPHVKNIRERTNWTHEPTLEDGLGHGTFVAGVIGSGDVQCPGFAPDVELYTFRVFTNDQVSYTSWFLDAFNYAMATEMHVVNLSIGGPDYLDHPFVDKVLEITSSGILMVSAIGNDGPLYGTLNNPADQNDVIGVGGIDYTDKIAAFSSRGMSTWELPHGYGRAKPDVVAYGRDVMGSRIQGGCRSLSGTSVASPVVAGAVCLLASTVDEDKRWFMKGGILNPGSMKQALVEGAERIPGIHMFEQGQGKLSLLNSMEILKRYEPRASLVPAKLDLTDCPFMWPFCRQPLYAGAMPLMFNATVLNGMAITGIFEAGPLFTPTNVGGSLLDIRFEYSDRLWPWSGHLSLFIHVRPEGANFTGIARGEISFTIASPAFRGEAVERTSHVVVPLALRIIPTPPRSKRILWDQFHSVRYPPAYLPRDSLEVRNDILDWHGDHPHTNYHGVYNMLRDEGYFLEVLASPFTCFNASQYGALLIVDSEEEFYPEEVAKLMEDITERGLGLLVFAEWYNVDIMLKMKFFDDNTRSWWTPVTGGGNVPALNDLLGPLGMAFGDAVLEGQIPWAGEKVQYASGANIVRFPAGGYLHFGPLTDKASKGDARNPFAGEGTSAEYAYLGLAKAGQGRVGLYGDSNCLDSSHQLNSCSAMLLQMLAYATEGEEGPGLVATAAYRDGVGGNATVLPVRRPPEDVDPFSWVVAHPATCFPNSPLASQGLDWAAYRKHRDVRSLGEGRGEGDGSDGRRLTPLPFDSFPGQQDGPVAIASGYRGNGKGMKGSVDQSQPSAFLFWARSFQVLPQVLGVLGAILIFVLWQLTPRRRFSGGGTSPPSSSVLPISLPDLGLRRPRTARSSI
eukprot:jgi/Botrbrau1/13498/Bobra.0082s0091.1